MIKSVFNHPRSQRLRFEARSLLASHPGYIDYLRPRRRAAGFETRGYWDMGLVDRDSVFVIDAFWRSGNTFALAAFVLSQGIDHRRVGHHACSPGQIGKAATLGVPAMVIARAPEDTILSCGVWGRHYPLDLWLRVYSRYYEGMAKRQGSFYLAPFSQVTENFGSVLADVNARFGTQFRPFLHNEAHQAEAFALIEANDRLRFGTVPEHQVSRPSAERRRWYDELRAHYHSQAMTRYRQRAEEAYTALTGV